MARLPFMLVVMLTICGCESDFDKCLNTELPRAELAMGVKEAKGLLLDAQAVISYLQWTRRADEFWSEWKVANPQPEGQPEYKCTTLDNYGDFDGWSACFAAYNEAEESYKSSSKYLDWSSNIVAALPSIKGEGFQSAATSLEEVYETYAEYNDIATQVVMSRALSKGCWGKEDCDDPLYYEYQTLEKNNAEIQQSEVLDQAISESVLMLTKVEVASRELATLNCNNNGFYE